jgi:hypothetical protein
MTKKQTLTYVKHQGVPYNFGGTIYMLSPLTINVMEQVLGDAEGIKTASENVAFTCRVVHASLLRNYENITMEQVREMVDTWNVQELSEIILKGSGLICAPTDEVPTLEKYREMVQQNKANQS